MRGTVMVRVTPAWPARSVRPRSAPASRRSSSIETAGAGRSAAMVSSVLGVFLRQGREHRLGVTRLEQPAAELGVLEDAADAREGLEVSAGRALRGDHDEEEVG